MAYCRRCGGRLVEGGSFCPSCGASVVTGQEDRGRRESFEGEVRRCPNCGESLPAFIERCSSCGYELRGVSGSSAVDAFSERLQSAKSSVQREDAIRTFHIPNTREDILEFFILATSNIAADDGEADVWRAKLDQAYQKAKLVFGEESLEFKRLAKSYREAKQESKAKSLYATVAQSRGLQALLLFCIGAFIALVGEFAASASNDPDSPFYMLLFIGLYCILGAFFLFIIGTADKQRKGR